ncbi:ribulokinase [bacterium]|nr:ribulokinase [bacterium]
MPKRYSLGLDFGTESGRAVLVDIETGQETATAVCPYRHGVLDECLPDGTRLPHDWALQHPADWLEVVAEIVPSVLRQAGAAPEQVVGIGSDFTSCTVLPIDKKGQPLCLSPKWAKRPHAWPKLWKHHAAQPEADRINALAKKRREKWLPRYGGKISSEWLFSKLLQILDEDPEIYHEMDRFIEASDWIVMQMTGAERRNSCCAGYKAMWHARDGYPSKAYFRALHPQLENVVEEKLSKDIYPLGSVGGRLVGELARHMGLATASPVAVGMIDAHTAVPACGVTAPGTLVMIMGTSTCHMLLSRREKLVEGISGVVKDGIVPGYYGYEAGQAGVGDIFAWCVGNGVPESYYDEARKRGMSMHQYLTSLVQDQKPGQSGLLALDWWNGCRSVLVNADLTGLLVGASLTTRPEEIYRALIEATAFGTRKIIETFVSQGVPIKEICACGGLADKNPLLMQIYADVTGRELKVSASSQTVALGSALFGAVVAGKAGGGYDSIADAAKKMARLKDRSYVPNKENHKIYKQLYAEYEKLHDYFGRGRNPVMKTLKEIRARVLAS